MRAVESKEWRQEDVGRRHPRGLGVAKAVKVEPRLGGNERSVN